MEYANGSERRDTAASTGGSSSSKYIPCNTCGKMITKSNMSRHLRSTNCIPEVINTTSNPTAAQEVDPEDSDDDELVSELDAQLSAVWAVPGDPGPDTVDHTLDTIDHCLEVPAPQQPQQQQQQQQQEDRAALCQELVEEIVMELFREESTLSKLF